jgi:hypothetical protein
VEGTTSKHLENIVAATQPISVMTRTFSPSGTSQLVAVSVLPMLALVHQQSDLLRAASNMTGVNFQFRRKSYSEHEHMGYIMFSWCIFSGIDSGCCVPMMECLYGRIYLAIAKLH